MDNKLITNLPGCFNQIGQPWAYQPESHRYSFRLPLLFVGVTYYDAFGVVQQWNINSEWYMSPIKFRLTSHSHYRQMPSMGRKLIYPNPKEFFLFIELLKESQQCLFPDSE